MSSREIRNGIIPVKLAFGGSHDLCVWISNWKGWISKNASKGLQRHPKLRFCPNRIWSGWSRHFGTSSPSTVSLFAKVAVKSHEGVKNVKINIFFLTSPGAKTQYWLNNSKSSHGTNCETIPLQYASAAQRDTKSKADRPRAFSVKNVKINIILNQAWNVWSGLLGENFVLNNSKSSHGTHYI